MSNPNLEQDPMKRLFWDEKTIVEVTGKSPSYWSKRRAAGEGPPFIKSKGSVLYHRETFMNWMLGQQVLSTGESIEQDLLRLNAQFSQQIQQCFSEIEALKNQVWQGVMPRISNLEKKSA